MSDQTHTPGAIAARYVDEFRSTLVRTYGWTELRTRIEVDETRRQVVVHGHTIVRRIARRFALGLRAALGTRYDAVVSMTTVEEQGGWYALHEPVTRLWRDASFAVPATELLRGDGPVQLLARTRHATLVRGADGTIGWCCEPVAASSDARAAAADRIERGWSSAARSYLGVPYRLGGTTRDGIDCSGLAQRLYRDVAGAIIPRHSTDQFPLIALRRGPRREGQLSFPDGNHVGIVVRRGRGEWSVIHASSSRGMVVEDPLP